MLTHGILKHPEPANVEIFFADLTSTSVEWYQTGPTEYTPVFFGITSDTAITRIRWHEGLGVAAEGEGNEEVSFDNLAVSRICIPEPSIIMLSGFSLILLTRRALKRKA